MAGPAAPVGRPAPQPLSSDPVWPLLAGVAAWLVALVVLALRHTALAHHHQTWWLWTCLAGLLMGGYGLAYRRLVGWSGTGRPQPGPAGRS